MLRRCEQSCDLNETHEVGSILNYASVLLTSHMLMSWFTQASACRHPEIFVAVRDKRASCMLSRRSMPILNSCVLRNACLSICYNSCANVMFATSAHDADLGVIGPVVVWWYSGWSGLASLALMTAVVIMGFVAPASAFAIVLTSVVMSALVGAVVGHGLGGRPVDGLGRWWGRGREGRVGNKRGRQWCRRSLGGGVRARHADFRGHFWPGLHRDGLCDQLLIGLCAQVLKGLTILIYAVHCLRLQDFAHGGVKHVLVVE